MRVIWKLSVMILIAVLMQQIGPKAIDAISDLDFRVHFAMTRWLGLDCDDPEIRMAIQAATACDSSPERPLTLLGPTKVQLIRPADEPAANPTAGLAAAVGSDGRLPAAW